MEKSPPAMVGELKEKKKKTIKSFFREIGPVTTIESCFHCMHASDILESIGELLSRLELAALPSEIQGPEIAARDAQRR